MSASLESTHSDTSSEQEQSQQNVEVGAPNPILVD